MKRLFSRIKKIPGWGWAAGIILFILQYAVYRLGAWISQATGTVSWAFEWKWPWIDDLFPVIPVFALIYLPMSYLFWICGPIATSLTKKRNFVNYLFGLLLAYLIGFLFFVFMPTLMDREKEGLMAYMDKEGFFNWMLSLIYGSDGGKLAFNLFPSYNCLTSLYCYLGVRKQPEISKGYKIFAFVMVVLICLSTLYTKQHYIVDVFGGLGIAFLCYLLMNKLDPGRRWVEKHPGKAKKAAAAAEEEVAAAASETADR